MAQPRRSGRSKAPVVYNERAATFAAHGLTDLQESDDQVDSGNEDDGDGDDDHDEENNDQDEQHDSSAGHSHDNEKPHSVHGDIHRSSKPSDGDNTEDAHAVDDDEEPRSTPSNIHQNSSDLSNLSDLSDLSDGYSPGGALTDDEHNDNLADDDVAEQDDSATDATALLEPPSSQLSQLSKEAVGSLTRKSDAAIYLNRDATMVEKVEHAIDMLHACKYRAPQTDLESITNSFSRVFSQPPKDGKEVFTILRKKTAPFNVVTHAKLKLGQRAATLLGPGNSKIIFHLYNRPGVDFVDSPATCNSIMETIVKFANAWPDAPLDDDTFRWTIIDAAISTLWPESTKVKAPTWTQEGLALRVPYYDTEKKTMSIWFRMIYTGISLETTFPGLPANVELFTVKRNRIESIVERDSSGQHQSLLPNDRDITKDKCFTQGKHAKTVPLEEIRARELFERFLSWKLSNRIATRKQMDEAASQYESLYISGKRNMFRHNRGHDLVKVWYHGWKKLFYMKARKTLFSQFGEVKMPQLFVRTPDYTRVGPIVEAIRRRWRETGNAAEAWLEAAHHCDMTNDDLRLGNPSPAGCYCTAEMKNDVTHLCQKCLAEVPCITRTRNVWGLYVCKSCAERQGDSIRLNLDVIKVGLQRQFYKEVQLLGRSIEDDRVQEVFQEGLAYLKDQMKGCQPYEWFDKYTNTTREVPTTFNPFFPSVEAIDPLTCRPLPGGTLQTWVHAAPNLAMIPHALNLAKGTALVSSLADIGENCALSPGCTMDEKRKLDEELLLRIAEQRLIAMKYSTVKKERVNASFTAGEYAAAKQEFRTGRLSTDDANGREVLMKGFPQYFRHFNCAWSEEEMAGITAVCDDIEATLSERIARSRIDGAPWPFPREPIPDAWDWDSLYSFLRERWTRMKFSCNKYWPTVDSKMGLACEMFYQLYGKSDEFLGLPMSGNRRSPLRLSVAHKQHGKQMRTGWPETPKSLKDRKAESNNILMETWFSNCLKFDFPEHFYNDLRVLVKSISIPKEIYDPHAAAPTGKTVVYRVETDDNLDESSGLDHGMSVLPTEEVLAAINGEDEEGVDQGDGHRVSNLTTATGPQPPTLAVLKHRLREARLQTTALVLGGHRTVARLMSRFLDHLLLDEVNLYEFAADVAELEDYVQRASMQMTTEEEHDPSPEHMQRRAAPKTARFKIFRDNTLELLTTPQLETAQALSLFLDMINSNLPENAKDYGETEATLILAHMASKREIGWDDDLKMVSKPR